MIECELDCPFSNETNQCTVTEESYKNNEAAFIANGYCPIPLMECPIYYCLVSAPWELTSQNA